MHIRLKNGTGDRFLDKARIQIINNQVSNDLSDWMISELDIYKAFVICS